MKQLCIPLLLLATACASSDPAPVLESSIVTSAPLIVTDMDGETHDLDATLAAGVPVALVFWQSW